MSSEAFLLFFNNMSDLILVDDTKKVVLNKVKQANENFEDLIVYSKYGLKITMYGEILEKIKKVNENIIFVFEVNKVLIGMNYVYFGFVYHDKANDIYVEISVLMNNCFNVNLKGNYDPFIVGVLRSSNDFNDYDDNKYKNVKEVIGDEAYDLFVNFMLTSTNNKVKSAIYKAF